MINNENENKQPSVDTENNSATEVAKMDVQCHLLIKDTDTGTILVNQRG